MHPFQIDAGPHAATSTWTHPQFPRTSSSRRPQLNFVLTTISSLINRYNGRFWYWTVFQQCYSLLGSPHYSFDPWVSSIRLSFGASSDNAYLRVLTLSSQSSTPLKMSLPVAKSPSRCFFVSEIGIRLRNQRTNPPASSLTVFP